MLRETPFDVARCVWDKFANCELSSSCFLGRCGGKIAPVVLVAACWTAAPAWGWLYEFALIKEAGDPRSAARVSGGETSEDRPRPAMKQDLIMFSRHGGRVQGGGKLCSAVFGFMVNSAEAPGWPTVFSVFTIPAAVFHSVTTAEPVGEGGSTYRDPNTQYRRDKR